MMIPKQAISRRTVPRGVGATLALPLFERPYHDPFGVPAGGERDDATVLAGALELFRAEMNAVSLWRGAALSALLSLLLVGIARRACGAPGGFFPS